MARPKLPESAKGKPVKIYLRNSVRQQAAALAFKKDISLSELINRLLARSINAPQSQAIIRAKRAA